MTAQPGTDLEMDLVDLLNGIKERALEYAELAVAEEGCTQRIHAARAAAYHEIRDKLEHILRRNAELEARRPWESANETETKWSTTARLWNWRNG